MCLKKLDEVFIKQHFSEQDTFEILGTMLGIRKALASYCVSQLLAGNTEGAIPYYDYLIEVPLEVLNHCIQVDDSNTFKSLLDRKKIAVNTSLADDHTVASSVVDYESIKCLLVLLDTDISLMAIYSRLFFSVYKKGQFDISKLEELSMKLMRIGSSITKNISYEQMMLIIDNNIEFLTSLLNKPIPHIIKRKNHSVHTLEIDTSLDLLRCLLEWTKLMKFILSSFKKDDFEVMCRISTGGQFNKLVLPGKIDASSSMDLSALFPYIQQALPLLESLNQQLDGLSVIDKIEFGTRIFTCMSQVLDFLNTGRNHLDMMASIIELVSYCSQYLSFPEAYVVKFKLMLGMNPSDEFMPFLTSIVSVLRGPSILSSGLNCTSDAASSSRFFRQPTRPENCIGWCQPPDGSYDDERGNTFVPEIIRGK